MSHTIYETEIQQLESKLSKLKSVFNRYSFLRLLLFVLVVFLIYKSFASGENYHGISAVISIVLLFWAVRRHGKISNRLKYQKNRIEINQDEADFIKSGKLPFDSGIEFSDNVHPYASDLDIFGEGSVFQYLNRTQTQSGKEKLSEDLLTRFGIEEIKERQEAIKELSEKLDFRHDFAASAKLFSDSKEEYEFLKNWNQQKPEPIPKWYMILVFAFGTLFIVSSVYSAISPNPTIMKLLLFLFLLNLGIFASQLKKINAVIRDSEKVDKILMGYSQLMAKIESADFESDKLNNLKKELLEDDIPASRILSKLSGLFSNLNHIENVIVTLLLNGSIFYHILIYNSFVNWHKSHSRKIQTWLKIIGEFESLSSFANFSYNNPDYCFPELNENYHINFKELGHPLISKKTRIDNDISFNDYQFNILTGSNMSGKSTFLRALGVNMILGGCGSAVCAKSAEIHPMNVLVSMRQEDSLTDSESYFFAEVKRLQMLIESLSKERSFILLDEILRGTNSDDKQSGTLGVIRKIIGYDAIGMIATHDTEVCKIKDEFPEKIMNRYFEVEIIDDELVFDYKLREGVCKNKSATFLMRKMGIID